MTIGSSGKYAVNNVDFTLPPTSAKWNKRDELGIDGNGHPVYPAVREYELKWNLMPVSDLKQIIDAYNLVSNTGTVSFDLPQYGTSVYTFTTYSGTTMLEPEMGDYFEEHVNDVRLVILNVRTG